MKFNIGMKVTVSCKALYDEYKGSNNFTIQTEPDETGEDGYWDLYNSHNELACMDGETCEIVEISENGDITLKNVDGEVEALFTLSQEEAAVGLFVNP